MKSSNLTLWLLNAYEFLTFTRDVPVSSCLSFLVNRLPFWESLVLYCWRNRACVYSKSSVPFLSLLYFFKSSLLLSFINLSSSKWSFKLSIKFIYIVLVFWLAVIFALWVYFFLEIEFLFSKVKLSGCWSTAFSVSFFQLNYYYY